MLLKRLTLPSWEYRILFDIDCIREASVLAYHMRFRSCYRSRQSYRSGIVAQ
jgi:hypothetical protein